MEPGTWDKGLAVRTLVEEVVSGGGTGEPPRPHSSLNTGHLGRLLGKDRLPVTFAFQLNSKYLCSAVRSQSVLFAKSGNSKPLLNTPQAPKQEGSRASASCPSWKLRKPQ